MYLHRSRVGAAVLLGVVGATGLLGCSSDRTTDEEHVSAACTALTDLESVLTGASAELADVRTVGELRTIRENVRGAYDEANSSLGEVAEDRAEALEDAWHKFRDEATSVEDEAAVTDARDSLVEEARALADARQTAQSGLACE